MHFGGLGHGPDACSLCYGLGDVADGCCPVTKHTICYYLLPDTLVFIYENKVAAVFRCKHWEPKRGGEHKVGIT